MNMVIGIVGAFLFGGLLISWFTTYTPTARVPSRGQSFRNSTVNLTWNLCSALLPGFLTFVAINILATVFGLPTLLAWAGFAFVSLILFGMIWAKTWYVIPGNSVLLTEHILKPSHQIEVHMKIGAQAAGDRQITCYRKAGPGFYIASWLENKAGLIQTEIANPLQLEYEVSFIDATGIVKVTVRFRADYRRMDVFITQGTTDIERFCSVAQALDLEIEGRVEEILTGYPILDAIRNIAVPNDRQNRRVRDLVIGIYAADETTEIEADLGIQIYGISLSINMSALRAKSHDGKGAARDIRDSAKDLLQMASEFAPTNPDGTKNMAEGWRFTNEAIAAVNASNGATTGYHIVQSGTSGNTGGSPVQAAIILGAAEREAAKPKPKSKE